MKVSSLDNASVQTPGGQLARLSGPNGYRFDGDTVHLNAMFALLNPAAHDCSWALQLWACQRAPVSATDIAGHLAAEVSLPPMSELADETEHFEVTAFATPPPGTGEHVMVLALVSGRCGQFGQIHDLSVYPQPQRFAQPRMTGLVGYRLESGRAQISVERVENPRLQTNRSGTLSLELWALSEPFTGGRFEGHYLAGMEIGSVNGECHCAPQPMDLAFNPPPAGNWQIVLMLREWTAHGFVTRDYTNFPTRFVSVVEKTPAPALPKAAAESPVVAKPVTTVTEKPPIIPVAKPAAAAPSKMIATVAAKAPAPEAPKGAAAVPSAKPVGDLTPKGVSVNTAPVAELAAVKGLNPRIAEGIVKKRPFASLDDLRKVKGFGVKLLAQVRSSLRL